jgi:DNA-binding MarR family transcriptional regulator
LPSENKRASSEPPPQTNIEAERSVLGSIILDNAALGVASANLSTTDFFFTHHKTIYRQMLRLHEAGSPIDLVTLAESLHREGKIEDAGGPAYAASLADGMPRVSNVLHYAKIVREKAALRMIAHLAEKLTRDAMQPDADLPSLQANLRTLSVESVVPTGIGGNGHLSYGLMDFLSAEFPQPEHLVEIADSKGESIAGLIPKDSTAMIFSMPHHLKSFFTTSLSLACTAKGVKFGKLLVRNPVRTLLVQMEDFPGQLQWRIKQLAPYIDIEPSNIRVLPRCDHKGNKINVMLPDRQSVAALKREIEDFGADLVIFDVVRRITNVDINSPKDSAGFLECMDEFRYCPTHPTIMLVHHENRKEADIMYASAGSYNLPGWANVMIQFKRKREELGVSHVEIEVDNKLAQSPEPMRMVLDLKSETPVRLENVEDTAGLQELRDQLGAEWTVRDLAEVMNVHKSNAQRRLKKFIASGVVEKLAGGKRGRAGGLARYRFVGEGE